MLTSKYRGKKYLPFVASAMKQNLLRDGCKNLATSETNTKILQGRRTIYLFVKKIFKIINIFVTKYILFRSNF